MNSTTQSRAVRDFFKKEARETLNEKFMVIPKATMEYNKATVTGLLAVVEGMDELNSKLDRLIALHSPSTKPLPPPPPP
jgi:hypothetical protein